MRWSRDKVVKKKKPKKKPPRVKKKYPHNKELYAWADVKAAELRERATPSEKEFMEALDYYGIIYSFQKPVVFNTDVFIVDFVIRCEEYRLCVEIDGEYHKFHRKEDKKRENKIKRRGYEFLRFTNDYIEESVNEAIGIVLSRNPERYHQNLAYLESI